MTEEEEARWVRRPQVLGPKSWHGPLAAAAIGGLQFAWGFEQAYVTIDLLDLGISQANLALLWLAGPLTGLIVQPLAGIVSDKWVGRFGRRRPFILGSTIVAVFSLLIFGWARELEVSSGISAKFYALSALVLLDVAINTCNASIRALIVDIFSPDSQRDVAAWAARLSTVGHLLSYSICALPLAGLLPGARSQLQAVVVISSAFHLLSSAITCSTVFERQLLAKCSTDQNVSTPGLIHSFWTGAQQYWQMVKSLDLCLTRIFAVQVCSWYAWFTFLFYGSAWAGLVWADEHNAGSSSDQQALAGAKALLVFSLCSTVITCVLPLIKIRMEKIWSFSLLIYAIIAFSTGFVSSYGIALTCFAMIGIPWAATAWIPFALVGKQILKLPHSAEPEWTLGTRDEVTQEEVEALLAVSSPDPDTGEVVSIDSDLEHDAQAAANSGAYLGLHNTAITLPQFLSSFGSFIIFQYTSRTEETHAGHSREAIALTIQVGSLAALLAAFLAYRLPTQRINNSSI